MPNLDGRGPIGQGPRTGRGFGNCRGGYGGGCRMEFGCRGCQRFISPKNELASLEEQEKMLEEELVLIREEKSALTKSE